MNKFPLVATTMVAISALFTVLMDMPKYVTIINVLTISGMAIGYVILLGQCADLEGPEEIQDSKE